MLENLIPPRSFKLHTQESISEMQRRLMQEISPNQRGWNTRLRYKGHINNKNFVIKPIARSSRYREILEIKGSFQETEDGTRISIKMIRDRSILFVYLIFVFPFLLSLLRLANEESSWNEFLFSLIFFCSLFYIIIFWSLPEAIERQYRDITEILGIYIDYPYECWKQQLTFYAIAILSFLAINFSFSSLSSMEATTCKENPYSSVYCNLSLSQNISYHLPLNSIAISADGKTLVSAGYRNIIAWDMVTGHQKYTAQINSSDYTFRSIAISNDNRVAIASTDDKSVKIWNLDTNRQQSIVTRHNEGVFNVTISPDSKTLVSVGGSDGLIQVWNLDTGRLKYTIDPHLATLNLGIIKINIGDSYVKEAKISPDGKILFTINGGKIHLWELSR